jgi:hypothetical protein
MTLNDKKHETLKFVYDLKPETELLRTTKEVKVTKRSYFYMRPDSKNFVANKLWQTSHWLSSSHKITLPELKNLLGPFTGLMLLVGS